MLEFIFQGFIEWIYSLILEVWNYFSSAVLDIMTLDFVYLKAHIPVIDGIMQVILAVGWALLLGNLVFQAVRSMAAGLGFEGEDPKLLFARTFAFAFLLLASPQLCELVLGMTSQAMELLDIPDALNVQLVDDSVFGVLTASWLLVIIFDLITIFMVLSLLLEVAERYLILAMLTITAPLAFAMGGSKSTLEIFTGWCRMFGSMCLLMVTNVIFFKMLLSVVSTIPSGLDAFPWMVLIVTIVKVAKKADEIITRIGLNPAITGQRSMLASMVAHTVFRTVLSTVTKAVGTAAGGPAGGAAATFFSGIAGKTNSVSAGGAQPGNQQNTTRRTNVRRSSADTQAEYESGEDASTRSFGGYRSNPERGTPRGSGFSGGSSMGGTRSDSTQASTTTRGEGHSLGGTRSGNFGSPESGRSFGGSRGGGHSGSSDAETDGGMTRGGSFGGIRGGTSSPSSRAGAAKPPNQT